VFEILLFLIKFLDLGFFEFNGLKKLKLFFVVWGGEKVLNFELEIFFCLFEGFKFGSSLVYLDFEVFLQLFFGGQLFCEGAHVTQT
jgi:hypothetical protein